MCHVVHSIHFFQFFNVTNKQTLSLVYQTIQEIETEIYRRILCPFIYIACMLSSLSCVSLFATPWTIVPQVPLSTGFPRQEYWSGSPLPSPGIFLMQGSNPRLLCLLHYQVGFLPLAPTRKSLFILSVVKYATREK